MKNYLFVPWPLATALLISCSLEKQTAEPPASFAGGASTGSETECSSDDPKQVAISIRNTSDADLFLLAARDKYEGVAVTSPSEEFPLGRRDNIPLCVRSTEEGARPDIPNVEYAIRITPGGEYTRPWDSRYSRIHTPSADCQGDQAEPECLQLSRVSEGTSVRFDAVSSIVCTDDETGTCGCTPDASGHCVVNAATSEELASHGASFVVKATPPQGGYVVDLAPLQ